MKIFVYFELIFVLFKSLKNAMYWQIKKVEIVFLKIKKKFLDLIFDIEVFYKIKNLKINLVFIYFYSSENIQCLGVAIKTTHKPKLIKKIFFLTFFYL